MNPDRWNQVQTLFKEVVELDHNTRETRLEQIRDEDPDLYEELKSLLVADADETSILDGFAVDSIDVSEFFLPESSRIGPFQLAREIGMGGMGTVYLAERVEGGFDQQVALKLIKFGINSGKILHRFEAERSILARLQHPNIARLIDGGLTDDNRPWFAMEYVQGEPIDTYCSRLNLPVEERIDLFIKVIAAIQHAHHNLIIHRDIKPDNILVSGTDGISQIKLLDFGIANMISDEDDHPENVTGMTKAYASPEQLIGRQTSISSDIYSLGVVLYELLAHCHPIPEFRRKGCSTETFDDELESICRKAMASDPKDRYQTANDLNNDLRNWLDDKPVSSFSNSRMYFARKFLSRNKWQAAITGLSVLAILSLIAIYTLRLRKERDHARQEALKASHVTDVLGNALQSVDPCVSNTSSISAKTFVDQFMGYINGNLSNEPETRAKLLGLIGIVYINLGSYQKADSVSAISYNLYHKVANPNEKDFIDNLVKRCEILLDVGKFDESGRVIHEAMNRANKYLDPNSVAYANVSFSYGDNLYQIGNYKVADSVFKKILPVFERNKKTDMQDYMDIIFMIGTNYRKMAVYDSAEVYLLKTLDLSRVHDGLVSDNYAYDENHLSSLYQDEGKYEKAIPYAQDSYKIRKKIYGAENMNTIASQANLARAYKGAGRLDEAGVMYDSTIKIFEKKYGTSNYNLAGLLGSYGDVLIEKKEYKKAEAVMRQSIAVNKKLLPPDDLHQSYGILGLGDVLVKEGRYKEALPYLKRSLAIRKSHLPETSPLIAQSEFAAGKCLWHLNQKPEARQLLDDAYSIYIKEPKHYGDQIRTIEAMGVR